MWALQKQNLRTKIPEQKFKTTSAKTTGAGLQKETKFSS